MMRLYIAALTLGLVIPSAHAGFFDALNAVTQVASTMNGGQQTGNANNQANNGYNNQNNSQNSASTTPLTTYNLSQMDCPSLEIAALGSSRELELAKANLAQIDSLNSNPQYQQQKATSSAIGALGGFLANKGGKTGDYAKIAQQFGGSANTTPDMDIDTQLALGKKNMTDLDNIRIYQKYKKCK